MTKIVRGMFSGALLVGLAPVAGAATTYEWKAVGGEYSGSFTDAAHWSPTPGEGEWPGSGYPETEAHFSEMARFPRVDGDYTVTLPQGVVTNVGDFEMRAQYGHTVTIDGSQTTWTIPTVEGKTPYKFFTFRYGNHDASGNPSDGGRLFYAYESWKNKMGVFKNFKINLSSHVDGRPGTLFDFSGDMHWENDLPLCPFGGETGDPDGRAEMRFRDGVCSRIGSRFDVGFASLTNVLTFSNYVITNVPSFIVAPANNTVISSDKPGLFEFNVTNESYVAMGIGMGYYLSNWQGLKYSINKTFRVNVADGATLASNPNATYPGTYELNVVGEGTKLKVDSTSWRSEYANSSNATMRVRVADGAHYEVHNMLYLGGDTAEKAATGSCEMLVTNSTFFVGGELKVYSGRLTFVNSHGVIQSASRSMKMSGGGFSGVPAELYADGMDFYYTCADGDNPPIKTIYGFTTAKLGPKGLTLVVHTTRKFCLDQSFTDWYAPGTLTIAVENSLQSMTLNATDSEESNLAIAQGTTILASGANHHSNLIVTNGATFNVAGTAAHLRSVTLGNALSSGTISLAPGTTLTIDGALSFPNGTIAYRSAPAVGTVQTLFRQLRQPTDTEVLFWEVEARESLVTGLNSSLYHKFRVVKDGDAWNYTISVESAKPEISATKAVWVGGDGGAWTNETSWTGATPGETTVVSFAGATPKTVTINGTVDAAGVEITADGYTLSGGRIRLSEAEDGDGHAGRVTLPTGAATVSSEIQTVAQTVFDVGADATLTVDGALTGGFSKTGDGRLALENAANKLPYGFSLLGGWLEFSALGAFGAVDGMDTSTLTGGTLEYDGHAGRVTLPTTITGPVVIKNETDLELPVPTAVKTSGLLFKRGAGKLVLATATGGEFNLKETDTAVKSYTKGDSVTYATDGSAPAKMGPLTVAESEVVFRGTGATVPTVTLGDTWTKRDVWVGVPTATHSGETGTEPGLVVDHAKVVANNVYVGNGITANNTFAVEPYVAITNGGTLQVKTVAGRDGNSELKSVLFKADAGTLSIPGAGDVLLNPNSATDCTNRYEFSNGSAFACTSFGTVGRTSLSFDHSIFGFASREAARTDWTVASFAVWGVDDWSYVGFSFANDSICSLRNFSTYAGGSRNFPIVLRFDNSEWWAGDEDRVLPASGTNMNVTVTVTGTGVKFAPPATRTWKWIMPIAGEGGFVKDGLGTFRFEPRQFKKAAHADPVTAGYAGLTDVRAGTLEFAATALADVTGRIFKVAGTLDLGGGTLHEPVFVPAGGTVKNVTCEGLTLAFDEDFAALTLDNANGFTTTGAKATVDFAEAPAALCEKGATFTFARWTGVNPPTVRWRGKNLPEGLKANFTTDGNDIVTTVTAKEGLTVIVR